MLIARSDAAVACSPVARSAMVRFSALLLTSFSCICKQTKHAERVFATTLHVYGYYLLKSLLSWAPGAPPHNWKIPCTMFSSCAHKLCCSAKHAGAEDTRGFERVTADAVLPSSLQLPGSRLCTCSFCFHICCFVCNKVLQL